jgi:predicted 3-demethylubiquinone-9 3-methyltransferase (glyoxalase superfamily)
MARKTIAKNTICLWYDKDAETAARFYAATSPDSTVGAIHRAPSDNPSTKAGEVLVVELTVAGVHCIGLNGGPAFKHNEAFSFQMATDDQAETDRYWNALVGNAARRVRVAGLVNTIGMFIVAALAASPEIKPPVATITET